MMRKVLILLLLVAIVATTSLPAGPVEDQAIEPQAKPESRLRPTPYTFTDYAYFYGCESCTNENDQEKKQDCKISRLECIVENTIKDINEIFGTLSDISDYLH